MAAKRHPATEPKNWHSHCVCIGMKQHTDTYKNIRNTFILATSVLFALTSGVQAITSPSPQAIENTSHLCIDQTARLEKSEKIPTHLLTAISLVETGRWQKGSKEIIAWPWTVTANGKGQHFDTKEEALAEVEILLTEGLSNIDVGCMQINLKYHENAFESLSQALDPKTNAEYAAKFLKKLYAKKKNWMKAAGSYHSNTPDKNLKYRAKLIRLWNKARRSAGQQIANIETNAPKSAASVELDYQRIARLNNAFQERRNADPIASKNKDKFIEKAMKRHAELDAWREKHVEGLDMKHLLAMRRAEQTLRQRKERLSRGKPKFRERRKKQLTQWRQTRLWKQN